MNKLKTLRMLTGMSQLELSYKTKIAVTTISQLENGKIYPYPGWRKKLARALKTSEEELFPEVNSDGATD